MNMYFDFFCQYTSRIIATLVILLATFFIAKVVNRIFQKAISDTNDQPKERNNSNNALIDSTQLHFLNRAVIIVIYFIGGCLALSRVPELQHAAYSLLAGSGVLAVILTFALREAFSNILAGLFINIFEPFKIGSHIKIDTNFEGIVKDITLHHTVLQLTNKNILIIPNTTISNKNIETINQKNEFFSSFDIYISYLADIKKALHILQVILDSHELLIDKRTQEETVANKPIAKINVENLMPTYIQLRIWIWTKNESNAYKVKCDTNFNVKESFDKQKIPFAPILGQFNQNLLNN